MVKDNGESKGHIKDLEEEILFWSELKKELEAEGDNPDEFVIDFKIGEGLE